MPLRPNERELIMRKQIKRSSSLFLRLFGYSFAFMCSTGYLSADECEDKSQAILTTTVEWQTPSVGNVNSDDPFSPVWHFNNSTYYVWVDATNRPFVTKITGGTPVTVPLDNNPDYLVQADGHHRFSMGIDKNGYIHITGDMHNYSYYTTAVITPYPARYQKQQIMYWKSNQPESVTNGFSFVGGRNASTAIPGAGWITGKFTTDNNGELYYSSQIHAIEAGNYPGQFGFGVYRYNADTLSWTALGGLPDKTRAGDYFTTLFWSNTGLAPSKWFQNYMGPLVFDAENRMHFALTCVSDSSLTGSNRLIYAVSNDGGTTWERADGTIIPTLPIRGEAGNMSVGDVVLDTGTSNFLGARVGVIADKQGVPSVFCDNRSFKWSGSAWVENSADYKPLPAPTLGYLDKDDDLLLQIGSVAKVAGGEDFSSKLDGYDITQIYGADSVSYNNLICIDEYALRRTGTMYCIGTDAKTKLQSILKTVRTPAPLPSGWSCRDIALPLPPYGGYTGYVDGKFKMYNYGTGITDKVDGFHFAYKTLSGDGTIMARVNTTLASADGYSYAGVMFREHLSANSIFSAMLLAPGAKDKGGLFLSRDKVGNYAS